jgi:hypothetical protein
VVFDKWETKLLSSYRKIFGGKMKVQNLVENETGVLFQKYMKYIRE